MGVSNGQPVSAETTNPAFLDANADDTMLGKLTLNNLSDVPTSGPSITNSQREHNAHASFMGVPINSVKDVKPTWTNNDVGASTDDVKLRADNLTQKFNGALGHGHTGAAGDGAPILPSNIPGVSYWEKFEFDFSDLSFAGLQNDIELIALPAKGILQGVMLKHSQEFLGGAISEYYLDVGIAGNFQKFINDADVFQAPGDTVFKAAQMMNIESFASATSIRLRATSVGANLDQATQGIVEIWILQSLLP